MGHIHGNSKYLKVNTRITLWYNTSYNVCVLLTEPLILCLMTSSKDALEDQLSVRSDCYKNKIALTLTY